MISNHEFERDIDVNKPSPARMYDYYLGGKDNYQADREAAEKALSVVPDGRQVARANRRFLVRAVKYMARHGIEQEAYRSASAPAVFRGKDEIGAMFNGFDLVKPGLVEVSQWRGSNRTSANLPALRFLGGVGKKRGAS